MIKFDAAHVPVCDTLYELLERKTGCRYGVWLQQGYARLAATARHWGYAAVSARWSAPSRADETKMEAAEANGLQALHLYSLCVAAQAGWGRV